MCMICALHYVCIASAYAQETTEAMHTSPNQPTHALAALSGDKNVSHSVNNCEEVVLL